MVSTLILCSLTDDGCIEPSPACPGSGSDRFLYDGNIDTAISGTDCMDWNYFGYDTIYPELTNGKCRNPDEDESGPWCFTNSSGYKEYCFEKCGNLTELYPSCVGSMPANAQCYFDNNPCLAHTQEYLGKKSTTVSGKQCIPWNMTGYAGSQNVEDAFCRNPDKDNIGPWCMTDQADPVKEGCFPKCACSLKDTDCIEQLPTCPESGSDRFLYNGKKDTTISGSDCANWDYFGYDTIYPELINRKCRNPDEDASGPWCFTNSSGYKEYCFEQCITPEELYPSCIGSMPANAQCYIVDNPCLEHTQVYLGNKSTTMSGKQCIPWNMTVYAGAENVEDAFCRNPDKDNIGPWCMADLLDPVKESCFPICVCSLTDDGCIEPSPACPGSGSDRFLYVGNLDTAISGTDCMNWDYFGYDTIYPELTNRRCRNPDNDASGPWCFTNSTGYKEYCFEQCSMFGLLILLKSNI